MRTQVLRAGGVGGRGLSEAKDSNNTEQQQQQAFVCRWEQQSVRQRAEGDLEGSGQGCNENVCDLGSFQSSLESSSSDLLSPIQQKVTLVRTVSTFLNSRDDATVSKAAVIESLFDVISPLLTEITMTDDTSMWWLLDSGAFSNSHGVTVCRHVWVEF